MKADRDYEERVKQIPRSRFSKNKPTLQNTLKVVILKSEIASNKNHVRRKAFREIRSR